MSDIVIITAILIFTFFAAFALFVLLFREAIQQRIVGVMLGKIGQQAENSKPKTPELKPVKVSSQNWNKDKVGNLYSFASNLTAAWLGSADAEPEYLRDSIRHCLWHANQLAFGEAVEAHLKRLCTMTDNFTAEDWKSQVQRTRLESELASVWSVTRFIVKGNDAPILPPADWFTASQSVPVKPTRKLTIQRPLHVVELTN